MITVLQVIVNDEIQTLVPVQIQDLDCVGGFGRQLAPPLVGVILASPVQEERKTAGLIALVVADGQIQLSISVQIGNGGLGGAVGLQSGPARVGVALSASSVDEALRVGIAGVTLVGPGEDQIQPAVSVQVGNRGALVGVCLEKGRGTFPEPIRPAPDDLRDLFWSVATGYDQVQVAVPVQVSRDNSAAAPVGFQWHHSAPVHGVA